ncbi:SPOR domain-containing protein [Tahibacter harae]|uniref:SPOR domain-containing protein n=1 Tax=Tahibacter harae TaxID=2963937 RepID=A0ABT1QXZ0_9GAMM|nr:SPOR domain-containing protein [Tahibacter harae]MCQ4167152.1 SPOR domain-containing protein [Tahibacter harae]
MKQRLIGAAVLIALAVIFVPMFLSGTPPKTDTVTENLSIPPAPEREFQTRVVPAAGGKSTIPEHVPAAGSDDKVATVEAGPNPRVEVPYPQQGAQPQATPAAPAKPTTVATAKPVEAAPAKPAPERAAPAASPTGRYAVHLGVFANAANADALIASARKQGLSAYAETADVDGKPATRVRLGPYEDRSTAEAARLKLQKADAKLKGSVVEIALAQPRQDAPAAALPANRAGGWAVQLGAFKSQDEANKLLARAKGAGFPSFVDSTGQGADKLWRVRLGPEPDRAGTEKLRDQVKQKLAITGMIVTVP